MVVNASTAKPLRIAVVADSYLPRRGGIEVQLRDLAAQFAARGHAVEIVTRVRGEGTVDGITVHRLAGPNAIGDSAQFTPASHRHLRRILRDGAYDVVQIGFSVVSPLAYAAARLCTAHGLPFVSVFHSVLTDFRLPLTALGSALGTARWRGPFCAVSSVVAQSLTPLARGRQVTVIPNGTDVEWWRPIAGGGDTRSRSGGVTELVSVSRLAPRKRPLMLLDTLAEAVGRAETAPFMLRVAGDGPLRDRMRAARAATGLDDAVALLGWQAREQVRDLLHQADLFVLPTRHEAFGIAALEARAAGVPVLAMASGGVRDFIEHGRDGYLARDDDDFRRRLLRFLAQPGDLEAMRRACRQPPAIGHWADVTAAHETLFAAAISGDFD